MFIVLKLIITNCIADFSVVQFFFDIKLFIKFIQNFGKFFCFIINFLC